ncbi:AraC family transcriptional regulator [Pedobacter sp. Leaf194]|uniref:AraC family transcriptional regulator n=1 Tax=Pedobacter sp. Leaf194 TaxID=1736297 RepID=UPI0007035423|nr:AraC family transcriptional regulator [Pedobacter sp. Leaf194]KQS36219.1 hypothetical protein ASG14_12380 [Pedobacter sp. Leaf194]
MFASRQINTSTYHHGPVSGEQYTQELLFSYQVSGKLMVDDDGQVQEFPAGSFRLVRKNRLLKYSKQPSKNSPYVSLSIAFRTEMLRSFADAHGYHPRYQIHSPSVIKLKKLPLYQAHVTALQAFNEVDELANTELIQMKIKETLLILLKEQPELQEIIFDFSQPVKTDISRFMQENFRHNLRLERFAYLSGRSLAAYKRDFEKAFQTSPGRWLLDRRLEEAHKILKTTNKKSTEIYLNIGFEDLSHFSRAFKNKFGIAPSKLFTAGRV